MGRLYPLQCHSRRRRQSLDDEHIVGAEARHGIVMNDPKRAQGRAVRVIQGSDQGFEDRGLNSGQISKCSLRTRQDNGRADVQTQPAGAEITRRAISPVSSQRATDCLPNEVRMAVATGLQHAEACAAGAVQMQHRIHEALQRARRLGSMKLRQLVEGRHLRA